MPTKLRSSASASHGPRTVALAEPPAPPANGNTQREQGGAGAVSLRKRVDPNELVILAKVAACGDRYGFLVEQGSESRAQMILVEDGYLTHTTKQGTARTYSQFKLTALGRKALALKESRP